MINRLKEKRGPMLTIGWNAICDQEVEPHSAIDLQRHNREFCQGFVNDFSEVNYDVRRVYLKKGVQIDWHAQWCRELDKRRRTAGLAKGKGKGAPPRGKGRRPSGSSRPGNDLPRPRGSASSGHRQQLSAAALRPRLVLSVTPRPWQRPL